MSLKGYIIPLALIGAGVAYFGVPKARSYVREIRHVREAHHVAPKVTIVHEHDAGTWDQSAEQDAWCRESGSRDRKGWYCEVREFTFPATTGALDLDAGGNGGINVEGWDRTEVRMRVKVQARARSLDNARELVSMVQIETSGDRVRPSGPKTGSGESWSTSFRASVPASTDLSLKAANGGIGVEQVTGDIEANATNGGISLVDVGGGVKGRTTNGGIEVVLAGDAWNGSGLNVQTTNGGIELVIPEDYNALLESGTTNGHLAIDFPITLQGKIGKKIRTQLGEGGPLVRAVTTNGSVEIRRR